MVRSVSQRGVLRPAPVATPASAANCIPRAPLPRAEQYVPETAPVISTFQALAVALLALLPGATYTFAYERRVGGFGVSLSDRLVRFLAASALFAALFSGPGMLLYRRYVASGQLGRGEVNAFWFEVVVLSYVLLPTAAGALVGTGQVRRWRWVTALIGDAPEPRAWDYLWRPGVQGVVRLKLKSGLWLAGIFGTTTRGQRSYAAGYPETQDLYLSPDPPSGLVC
jgi:hypothetical protein